MKKALACAVFLFPLAVMAADPPGGRFMVYLNGKPFASAQMVHGIIAVSMADVARAAGMANSLEPAFQLQGNSLHAAAGWDVKSNQKTAVAASEKDTSRPTISDLQVSKSYDKASPMLNGHSTVKTPAAPGQLFRINKAGAITNNLITDGTSKFIPVEDFAHALGAQWKAPAGGLAPGATIQLNFTSSLDHILIGL